MSRSDDTGRYTPEQLRELKQLSAAGQQKATDLIRQHFDKHLEALPKKAGEWARGKKRSPIYWEGFNKGVNVAIEILREQLGIPTDGKG